MWHTVAILDCHSAAYGLASTPAQSARQMTFAFTHRFPQREMPSPWPSMTPLMGTGGAAQVAVARLARYVAES